MEKSGVTMEDWKGIGTLRGWQRERDPLTETEKARGSDTHIDRYHYRKCLVSPLVETKILL